MLKWIAQVKIAQAKCERKMLRFSPHKMFKWDAGASVTIPLNQINFLMEMNDFGVFGQIPQKEDHATLVFPLFIQ